MARSPASGPPACAAAQYVRARSGGDDVSTGHARDAVDPFDAVHRSPRAEPAHATAGGSRRLHDARNGSPQQSPPAVHPLARGGWAHATARRDSRWRTPAGRGTGRRVSGSLAALRSRRTALVAAREVRRRFFRMTFSSVTRANSRRKRANSKCCNERRPGPGNPCSPCVCSASRHLYSRLRGTPSSAESCVAGLSPRSSSRTASRLNSAVNRCLAIQHLRGDPIVRCL